MGAYIYHVSEGGEVFFSQIAYASVNFLLSNAENGVRNMLKIPYLVVCSTAINTVVLDNAIVLQIPL